MMVAQVYNRPFCR